MPVTTVTLPLDSLPIDPSAEWDVSGAADVLAALQASGDGALAFRRPGVGYAVIRAAVEAPAVSGREVVRRVRVVARHSRTNSFSLAGLRVAPNGWLAQAGLRATLHDAFGPWVSTWDEVGGKPLVEFGDDTASAHNSTVSLSRLYAEAQIINPTAINLTGPSPTEGTDHPTVTWDNSGMGTGDVVRIIAYDRAAHDGLDPDTSTSTPLIDTGGWGPSGAQQIGPLPPSLTIDLYAQVVETHGGIPYPGEWDHREFTVRAPVPATPQLTASWIHQDQAVELTIVSRRNLLAANIADGTDPAGSTTGFTAVGGSIQSSSTAQAWINTRSLRVERVGSAGTVGTVTAGGPGGVPVVGGQAYTTLVHVRPTTAQDWQVRINWFDADGDPCTPPNDVSAPVAVAPGDWTRVHVTATAPADAAFASLQVWAEGVPASEAAFLDGLALHRGTQPIWGVSGIGDGFLTEYFRLVRDGEPLMVVRPAGDVAVVRDRTTPRGQVVDYSAGLEFHAASSTSWGYPGQPVHVVSISDGQWWIKHPTDPSLDTPVRARTVWSQSRTEHGDVHQPLDSNVSIKVSGDTYGDDGSLQFFEVGAGRDKLHKVLSVSGPLLLQDCYGDQRWIAWTPGAWRWDLDGPPATARYKTSRDYVAVAQPPVA